MKIEAFKADDDTLYENEIDCRKHNIELQLKAWMKKDREVDMYDVYDMNSYYERIVISKIAEKIVNNKQSFNEIFSKLMEI